MVQEIRKIDGIEFSFSDNKRNSLWKTSNKKLEI
jgi:hypothetical protein